MRQATASWFDEHGVSTVLEGTLAGLFLLCLQCFWYKINSRHQATLTSAKLLMHSTCRSRTAPPYDTVHYPFEGEEGERNKISYQILPLALHRPQERTVGFFATTTSAALRGDKSPNSQLHLRLLSPSLATIVARRPVAPLRDARDRAPPPLMSPTVASPPSWKRRPIFIWQLRTLLLLSVISLLSYSPALIRHTTAFVYTSPSLSPLTNQSALPDNPCALRPTPPPLPPKDTPPTLLFIHVPKTAGTLMYKLAMQYANRTHGLACNYLHDGERYPASAFVASRVPQTFDAGTPEDSLLSAIQRRDAIAKATALSNGVCRSLRGHVTYRTRAAIRIPVLTVTILRDPLARFVSMYEFVVAMVRARPGKTGWDRWVDGSTSLAAVFANSSSIFHRGFVDEAGKWIVADNVGFSFHFYGVLHQLSGVTPVFDGVQDPYHFRMRNDAEMAERAKDNLCSSHVVGAQESMDQTWKQFFGKVGKYANWSEDEQRVVGLVNINRTPGRRSRNVDDHLPERIRAELERRLVKEIEVVEFARRIIEYRKALRERAR